MAALRMHGEILSPGVAVGRAHHVNGEILSFCQGRTIASWEVAQEIGRFLQTVEEIVSELEEVSRLLELEQAAEQAQIVRAHMTALSDPHFHEKVSSRISAHRMRAEQAIEDILQEMSAVLRESGNAMLADRAADFADVERRLKRKLCGGQQGGVFEALDKSQSVVVLVEELLPSYIFEAVDHGLAGFVVSHGTRFSHAVILARLYDIPVLKLSHLPEIEPGSQLLLDATAGQLVVRPERRDIVEALTLSDEEELAITQAFPAELWLNIVDPRQIEPRRLALSSGIGLFRTEVIFMKEQEDFPSEQQQFEIYRALFDRSGGKTVTVRTLDIGGDKPLPYFSAGHEPNPYLGLRAHRIYQHLPGILRTQLRAILRAGAHSTQLRILYPMIESLDSLRFVQSIYLQAAHELEREGMRLEHVRQGVLVEVPSAVWSFGQLLAEVDFASLGTNDMLQYLFAADRNNPNVIHYYDPEHPTFLQILSSLSQAADAQAKPLSICGEIASSPRMLPLLVGLGIKHLSIDAHTLHAFRRYLAAVDVNACRKLAEQCLQAHTADEVHELLDRFRPEAPRPAAELSLEDTQAVDPICKLIVSTRPNPFSLRHGGQAYYFCSRRCRDSFLRRLSEKRPSDRQEYA